jgi:hypothetical protein
MAANVSVDMILKINKTIDVKTPNEPMVFRQCFETTFKIRFVLSTLPRAINQFTPKTTILFCVFH